MLLVRYWEDSFLICQHDLASEEEAYDSFEKLANKVKVPHDDTETITISIGVARCNHDPEQGYLSAFELARKALLAAQRNGEAQVVCHGDGKYQRNGLAVQLLPTRDTYIRTFGYFEVFLNGEVLMFRHEKSKELLALLATRA